MQSGGVLTVFILGFQGEESNAAANKCMLKVAQYAAQLENYPRAIEIYEQVSPILVSALHILNPVGPNHRTSCFCTTGLNVFVPQLISTFLKQLLELSRALLCGKELSK